MKSVECEHRCSADQVRICHQQAQAIEPVHLTVHNHREYDRHTVRGVGLLRPMGRKGTLEAAVQVDLRDVGHGGISFLTDEPLCPGSYWRLTFLRDGYAIGEAGVVLRHCTPLDNNNYHVGGDFILTTCMLYQLGIAPAALEKTRHQYCETLRHTTEPDSYLPASEVA